MDHTADLLCMCFCHDVYGVLCRIPGVDNDGLFDLARQIQLSQEPLFLCLMIRLRPVIIQSDLSHRQAFFLLALLLQPGIGFLVQFRGLAGMHADCSVDVIVRVHQLQYFPAGRQARAYIHHSGDSLLRQRCQKLFSVFIKCVIVIMRMSIKYRSHAKSPICTPLNDRFQHVMLLT